ncbi:sugar phosphate nucleotidyltransferase [Fodinibius sp. SL11]|uniref:sugar phosphate nucleotidyltransferase n=1 Tax=Fodinibius sp. SL11 TaxID=3425690 RepID=UPI003F881E9E
MNSRKEIVGLIPAAGFASRIASHLSCSKEMHPIPLGNGKTCIASSFLIESFREAKVQKSYIILRNGKWDIPEYLLDGREAGIPLAYIVSESTQGVPYTLDKAYPFITDNIILLGFPDIIFEPLDAFNQLLVQQQVTRADLVLGLFKTDKPEKADMVVFDEDRGLKDIIIKPEKSAQIYTWIIAVWTPVFTQFMHEYINNVRPPLDNAPRELHIGDVVRAAIKAEIKTSYLQFDSGSFLDIGTPAELEKIKTQDWITAFNKN